MQKATLKMIKTRAGPCAVGDAEGARSLTTSRWALGTAVRTAAMFDTDDLGTAEPRASGPLRLLSGDLPQGH